ncbi:MAG TPA: cyclic nucleotide-binding domain-containing protein [Actinomycetota bacterium]|nr:cyclic nucleotide-binding domain-containing protein [Actinomycetota bacterium]
MEFPMLLRESDPQAFSQGSVIFRVGEPGDLMYAVKEGEVALLSGDTEVERVGANGVFGEMALIDKEPRSATAVARTDCQLVLIDRNRFERLVGLTPGFALSVMKLMADRIRGMNPT